MEKLHFSILIDASKEKVWHVMLDDATYRQWTEAFAPGSYYVGNWETGTEIKFLGPNEKGSFDGMLSRIKESRPYEFVSIEHLGIIHEGKEDRSGEEVKNWQGALENYSLKESGGNTEVLVDIDVADKYKEMFSSMWPKALEKLKAIAETRRSS